MNGTGGSGSRGAVCVGSPACGGLAENLCVIRYLKVASSRICIKEMNSDPPLCLQFYASQMLAACFFGFYNTLFSAFVCIIWSCGGENGTVSFVQPQRDADADRQRRFGSTTKSSRANDAVVTKVGSGGWLRSMWSKTSEGWAVPAGKQRAWDLPFHLLCWRETWADMHPRFGFSSGWLFSSVASHLSLFWSVSALSLMVSFLPGPPQAPDPRLHVCDPHSLAVLCQQA